MAVAESVDIVVIGGGPVGAAFALALRGSGLNCRVLESRDAAPAGAWRPVALAHGSRMILERLGAWRALGTTTPIERIHVSQRGGPGMVRLSAREADLPALGYVVDYETLVRAMASAVGTDSGLVGNARVCALLPDGDRVLVRYRAGDGEHTLAARLAVVADGGGIGDIAAMRSFDYRQVAVTSRVETTLAHRHTAYERFTPDGPLALLPFGTGMAVVWTVATDKADALCAADENAFLAALQDAFGNRLGRIARADGRAAHPLGLRFAAKPRIARVVLAGNAAQALHPVAGQGFNLGLRDAWELAQLARQHCGPALGGQDMLRRYRERRRIDRGGGIAFTHALVRGFSNDVPPLRWARGAGLALLGCLPPVKDFRVRRMTFGARG